eukprot:CAMPEP_0119479532 /NCGR_PEP_ID=MMETSP1344-20130328/8755_1 /TAXON_ID=236787 /ORGANISM="Florenciella parvula, Strain CCMP2471" /LENGTH=94 /DNA_ID=CAMNT_0007513769 /DNA_START=170 /DNA_END=455 /DNA_ORIENTATION=+
MASFSGGKDESDMIEAIMADLAEIPLLPTTTTTTTTTTTDEGEGAAAAAITALGFAGCVSPSAGATPTSDPMLGFGVWLMSSVALVGPVVVAIV